MARQAGWHDTSFPYLGGVPETTRRSRGRWLPVLLFGLGISPVAGAQTQLIVANPGEKLPSFEVAAIRPDNSGPYHTSINFGSDSFRAENLTIRDLIRRGWETRTSAQIQGGPGSLMDQRFDVDARIDPDDMARLKKLPPDERAREMALMVQDLLADRFHLAAHVETKDMRVYALILAKGGPRFHASPPPASDATNPVSAPSAKPHGDGFWIRNNGKHTSLTAYGSTMDALASVLSGERETGGRYVINKTGLTGKYDYTLEWAPEYLRAAVAPESASNSADPAPTGPSLFTALEDQLGLKLVQGKAPVQVLVIDHVEPPSAN